jgi:hypothetical protein
MNETIGDRRLLLHLMEVSKHTNCNHTHNMKDVILHYWLGTLDYVRVITISISLLMIYNKAWFWIHKTIFWNTLMRNILILIHISLVHYVYSSDTVFWNNSIHWNLWTTVTFLKYSHKADISDLVQNYWAYFGLYPSSGM